MWYKFIFLDSKKIQIKIENKKITLRKTMKKYFCEKLIQ